jgi:hypothetical protein
VIVVETNIRLSVSLDLMIDLLLFAIDAVMFCYNQAM